MNMKKPSNHSEELGPVAALQPIVEQVNEALETRPYQTLAVAVGLGVVLGGGWGNWALRGLANAGVRALLAAAVSRLAGGAR